MSETLVAIKLPPGQLRNGTTYASKNRWYATNLIRWVPDGNQYPPLRPVGGWSQALTAAGAAIQASGFPRMTIAWRKNDSSAWLAVGTNTKLYAYSAGVITDITPAGIVTGAADGSSSSGFSAWGAGNWGAGPWGGAGAAGSVTDADTWQLDTFGEILLGCLTSDGKIYESTPTAVATQVTNSPTGCRGVVVTPERFIFALGASSDPRNVAWCSQQARTVWTPSAANSAGSFPLQTAGRLMAGRRADRETLLWTDTDLWSAVYIGGPLYYSFQRRDDACGLIGPNAVTMMSGAAYWMGDGKFFTYAGAVRSMPCDVLDYVFSDLSRTQKAKIVAFPNWAFDEVWWFYPSSSQAGTENDRYVKVNVRTGYWDTGVLARAACCGAGVFPGPQMWDSTGLLYSHETGNDRGGNIAYVESGPLEIGDGDNVVRIQSLIPDEKVLGQVRATFYSALRPMDSETATGPYTLTSKTDVRVPEARQHRLRLDDNAGAQDFRIGTFRLGAIKGGRRL